MIHLSGKDSFVIYQDTISKKNKIAVGQWHLFDFKKKYPNRLLFVTYSIKKLILLMVKFLT
jgi:hypothetical protein